MMTTCLMPPNPVGEGGEETASAEQKSVSVIFNPVSGKADPEERKNAISAALAEHGYTAQFIATTEERGARALAQEAIREGVDLLVVSGGDGTVMETLSAAVGTDIPVAILPAGTGNLLSVNLGIPTVVPEAVNVALSGSPYRLDLARTSDGRYFAIMGGIGLDGKVIEEADREAKDRFGVLAYVLAAIRNIARPPATMLIYLDQRRALRRRAKSVLIANMGKMTAGVEALPTAAPNDGNLDVGILMADSLLQWLRLLWNAFRGRTHEDPALEVYQARKVRVHAMAPHPVEFDGEEGGYCRDLSVEVVHRAVSVLLPEGASAAHDIQEPPAVHARKAGNMRMLQWAGVLLVGGTCLWLWHRRRSA